MKHIEKSINSINTSKTYNKPYKYWVFKDFLEQSTDKKPSNDKSSKNPDTPEA